MKFVLLLSIFLFGYVSAHSQVVDESLKIKQVRNVVDGLVNTKAEAVFFLFYREKFYPYRGKVIGQTEYAFRLEIKKNHVIKIFYKDVFVISAKNLNASFLPGPELHGFGRWETVQRSYHYHWLEVVLENGQRIRGRLIARAEDKITLVAEPVGSSKFTEFTLLRDQITYVYRLFDIYGRENRGGNFDGIRKGAKAGASVGGPEGAVGAVLGAGIGAIFGGIKAADKKEPNSIWMMIYSK